MQTLPPSPSAGTPDQSPADGLDPFRLLRAWQDFLLVTETSERTREVYLGAVIRFMYRTLSNPLDVSESELIAYLQSLAGKGGSRGEAIRAFRSLFAWRFDLARGERSRHDPTRRLHVPRPKYGPAPSLDPEDLNRLVLAAYLHEPRRGWALMFAYATGARLESLCNVLPEDVHLYPTGKEEVYFRVAKGNRPYRMPLEGIGLEAAKELLNIRAGMNGHTPPSLIGVGPSRFWEWVKQASRVTGLDAWPHLLRHSFGQHMAEALETPEDVLAWQELMNHADLSQFPRYARSRESTKRKGLAKLGR